MNRKVRIFAALSAAVLVLASCGGGESSSRTRNSALCYADQAEKDAAVQAARDAFDAAMGGESSGDVVDETPTSVVEETPTTIGEETPTSLEGASGGGYRRPAVRAASSGDSTVPPSGDSDSDSESEGEGDGTLTPEQQQAQMDLEAAEAQPLCETDAENTSEVTCTATRTMEGVTDDCADGDVIVEDSNGGEWKLVGIAEDGSEVVLAQGTYDVTTLGIDNPIVIPISYGGTSGEGETSSDGCTAVFTSTGVSWDCPNGELFNVAIEDISNPGVYPLAECSSSGSHTVADGQTFWFNFSLGATFFDGWNNEREQNVPISFEVPEDTEGVCSEIDAEEIDWDALPFSGQSEEQVIRYSFTVPEDFGGPVFAKFESTDDFDVDIDDMSDFEDYSCWNECPPFIGYSVWDLAPGEYFIEIEDNIEMVTWTSNIQIVANPFEFPTLPYSYTSDGSRTMYALTIAETQTVTLTATAGQTCLPSEDDDEGNGFADPELDLFGNGVDESDDNSGHGAGNCSASFLEIELEPGTYSVYVEDDDKEGGSITLGSSVELQQLEFEWDLEAQQVVDEAAIEFVVPEGGAWFKAKAFTNQLETYIYDAKENGNMVGEEGCNNPDGDLETNDGNCVYTSLELYSDEISLEYVEGNAEYGQWSQVGNLWVYSYINSFGSEIEMFLPEGTYQMSARGESQDDSPASFELEYGFGSANEIVAKPIDAPPAPPAPSSADLPVGSLVPDSRVATSVSTAVEEFICDSLCIEAMFTNAGLSSGSISISAGAETVVLTKGQKRAKIPVGKGADTISATATSADGATVVNLNSKIAQIPASVQASIESKTGSSSSESGSNLLMLIVLGLGVLVIAGAGTTLVRRRKAN